MHGEHSRRRENLPAILFLQLYLSVLAILWDCSKFDWPVLFTRYVHNDKEYAHYTYMLAYCISNTDCASLSGTRVCKEMVPGGARTCRAVQACSTCLSGQFCDSDNTCQYGE